ncbi:DUF4012 domain-containing protein [Candidatus Uhrbacteria bacterium]|nr:DUF4012 domain-containing protein [Candidatus Uhrbacteria bacterium]
MEDELFDSRSGIMRGVLVIILLIVIAAGVLYGYRTWKRFGLVNKMVIDVQTHLTNASQDFLPENFFNAKMELQSAAKILDDTRDILASISVLGAVPFTEDRYHIAVQFSEAAHSYIDTGIQLAELVEHISESAITQDGTISFAEVTPAQRAIILERTVQSIPAFNGIRAKLALLARQLSSINDESLDEPYRLMKYDLLKKSGFIEYSLGQIIPFLEVVPRFLGYADDKTYLILFQDVRRVRGTGGLITLYGIMRVKDGSISDFKVSNPDADPRLASALPAYAQSTDLAVIHSSFLQDTNWEFDFPAVAQQMIERYRTVKGEGKIDGVIAVDHDFFISLLRFIGPIRVRNTIFSADSFTQELDFHRGYGAYRTLNPPIQPNDPIADLVGTMIDSVNKMPFSGIFDVVKVVEARLHEKHILLWFDDPKLQEFSLSNNWTGHTRRKETDYVMVVDSNITDKDTDSYIERAIGYELTQDSLERLNAKLDIVYRNNSTITENTGHYATWLRIVIPRGSEVFAAQGFEGDIHRENRGEVTVVSGIVPVRSFQKAAVRLEYRLPITVAKAVQEKRRYDLLVQRQPGSKQSLTVSLFFQKPLTRFTKGGFFASPTHGQKAQEATGVKFVSDVRVDREFMAQF